VLAWFPAQGAAASATVESSELAARRAVGVYAPGKQAINRVVEIVEQSGWPPATGHG